MADLKCFFNPARIALIGATDREASISRVILENLMLGADKHEVYPVHHSRTEVLGLKCYAKVGSLPEPADLAIIATPAATVPDLVDECARAGVKGVIIISSGFKEIGDAGQKREQAIANIQKEYDIRIIGPNCMGVIRPSQKLNTTFIKRLPKTGNVAFLSQSGALGAGILDWAIGKNLGLSAFVSLGSMLDVDFSDLIDYFGRDIETSSIIIYPESIGNARKFMSAARSFARTKPIIVLKPGKFLESAQAVKSHTGAIVGEDMHYDAIFRRAGIIRVNEIRDLFQCASILNTIRLPKGPNLAIVSNGGGPAILATDSLLGNKGKLAKLTSETISQLNKLLPPLWSGANPVDLLEDADIERYRKTIEIIVKDPKVNGLLIIYTPQGPIDHLEVAKAIVVEVKKTRKPVIVTFVGESVVTEAREYFYEHKIPCYGFPEEAVRTYLHMYSYARNMEMLYETAEESPLDIGTPRNHLHRCIRHSLQDGLEQLNETDTFKMLRTYGITTTAMQTVTEVEHAVFAANDIGYPVAMKISSPDIVHKTDCGGVMLNINCEAELRDAYREIHENVSRALPKARVKGISIHQMVSDYDYELIIGSKKDPEFGPVIIVGQGGLEAEFFRDVAVGIPPLNHKLARRLYEQTRIYSMLAKGFRNKPPVDLKMLDDILVRVSDMLVDFPEIKELDINPVAVSRDHAVALDARIILDTDYQPGSGTDYSHLVIMPYPSRYVQNWRCRDGTQVLLRPIRPEDEEQEGILLSNLSEESQRFRFFNVLKEITHDMLTKYCNIDYDREIAIVAECNDGGKARNVGVAHLSIEPGSDSGEFAVLVADDFQGRGLGLKLTDVVIGVAEDKGLKSIYGIILNENARMAQMVTRLGFKIERTSASESKITLEL
jgi:acetyltransferase